MAKPKRPKDPVSRAVLVGRMLIGDAPKDTTAAPNPKQTAGSKGGAARAKALTAKKRSEIAKKAAGKRWGNKN